MSTDDIEFYAAEMDELLTYAAEQGMRRWTTDCVASELQAQIKALKKARKGGDPQDKARPCKSWFEVIKKDRKGGHKGGDKGGDKGPARVVTRGATI